MLLGVSRQRVLVISRQPGFPKPLAVLKLGNGWLDTDVRSRASAHRPPATSR